MLKLKIRLFQKCDGKLEGIELGRREEDSSVNQPGKDGIEVEEKLIFTGNSVADMVELEIVIQLLKKEVSSVKGALLVQFDFL